MNPTSTWFNSVVYRVSETSTHVYFTAPMGGFVYKCTKEQWQSGKLTEVE